MDDVPFFNTMDLAIRGGIFDSASKYFADKPEENGSEDSASIKSGKSDKSTKSTKSVHTVNTVNTFNTANTSATTSTSKHDGLRYRNKNGTASPPIKEDDVPERHAIVRADTSPSIAAAPSSKKAPTSFKMFNSRPSSVRTDSTATATTASTNAADTARTVSDTPRTMSIDSASMPTRAFELQASSSVDPALARRSIPLDSATSISESNDTLRSLTPNRKEELTRELDPSDPPSDLSPNRVTTGSLMTAVRARDKAGLQTQANVAKEGIKKWGINFVNKRRTKLDENEDEDGSSHPPPAASAYYAPSAEEREIQQHQPRTSLQERLNAAAHAKRESNASQHSIPPAVASRTSQDIPASPTSSTFIPTPIKAAPRVPVRRPSQPERPDAFGTSPPPAPRMVVPSVPKRAGVVTGIGHTPTSTSAEALDQVDTSAGDKPSLPRAESDPTRSASAPVDSDLSRDKSAVPQPEVTAASVTTRTAAGEGGSSPARQSLLGYYRSNNNSNGNSNVGNANEGA